VVVMCVMCMVSIVSIVTVYGINGLNTVRSASIKVIIHVIIDVGRVALVDTTTVATLVATSSVKTARIALIMVRTRAATVVATSSGVVPFDSVLLWMVQLLQ